MHDGKASKDVKHSSIGGKARCKFCAEQSAGTLQKHQSTELNPQHTRQRNNRHLPSMHSKHTIDGMVMDT